jgi:hypothetical protein
MVNTRLNNKTSNPGFPDMTEYAKKKAGLKSKRQKKKITKDETIRLLQARITALEDPATEPPSKEPLVRCTQSFTL